ncbi:cadherin-89D isoform X2 [Halyomorpha halys]|uniref:cadherin-89D isoform X2 n=1 Tax=Halyomorpha halys TaxID=286706 RepID=UPI000D0C8D57|nr:cadherin-89D isoform X2 [Halyomorpha halys]
MMNLLLLSFSLLFQVLRVQGCQFYPIGEYLRFVRVPESLEIGSEILLVEVHPRRNLSIQPVDLKEDAHFFKIRPLNSTHVSLRLSQSLENLVDNPVPQNVLKFRLACDSDEHDETTKAYLSTTVYVEDVNDHDPVFIDAPYEVNVDELTPTGLTVFRGVQAVDMDKPNTPNSELIYTITGGNPDGRFSLEMTGQRPALVLKKSLDYDGGDTIFNLTVTASDGGTPRRSTNTHLIVKVQDSDDLNPKFTRDLYRAKVAEYYPITGKIIHRLLPTEPVILAYDQDLAINSTLRYDILSGNEKELFFLDPQNGSLFLEKEVDLESLPDSVFVLQIEASQLDNPLRRGMARLEVEILDINDNQPQFEVGSYNISIVENLPNGFSVLQVVATDMDQGNNAEFAYHLVDPSQSFSLDSRSGWLTVRNQARLDRETRPSLNMRVMAREKTPSVLQMASDSSVNVEVTLLDANDNNPTFLPSNLYEFSVTNLAPIGFIIGKVKAVDPDIGRNGLVRYELKKDNKTLDTQTYFSVSPINGEISVIGSPLPVGRRSLFIEASDQPENPSERRLSLALASIEVTLSGKSGIAPDFVGAPYEFWVGDDVPVGTSVGQIRISEAVDKSRVVFDLLHSYHEGVPFAIEERSGVITVVDEISKYENSLYDFEAVVTDEKRMTLVTNVTIHIVESAVSHLEKPSLLEFRVKENKAGDIVGRIVVGVRKGNPKFSLLDDFSAFSIAQDGTLYTKAALDRELRSSYFMTVVAQIGRAERYYQVHVTVEDENDNPPKFTQSHYEIRVQENWKPETPLLKLAASDSDLDSNIWLTLKGKGSELFTLSQSGSLRLKRAVDREERSVYTFSVIARDQGNLSSEASITVHVEDENDNKPKFVDLTILSEEARVVPGTGDLRISLGNKTIYQDPPTRKKREFPTLIIPETFSLGVIAFRLLATDQDLGENGTITYGIASESNIPFGPVVKVITTRNFAVHPVSGEVTLAGLPTPESEYLVNFTAVDGGGLHDWSVVRIKIEDINNNAPIFEKTWYDFDVPEGSYKSFGIGKVTATDADFGQNGNVTYSILQKKENFSVFPFKVGPQNGEITVTGELDRETIDLYSFKVLAQDNGPFDNRMRSTVEVMVRISDVNDNPPVFYGYDRALQTTPSQLLGSEKKDNFERSILLPVYFASVAENSAPGIPIARILTNDSDLPDNGNGIVVYDILRKKNHRQLFAIDKEGTVTVTSYLDFETQAVHNVTIIASDLGNPSLSATALLIVTVVDVVEAAVEEKDKSLIPHNYYELEVDENCFVPVELLQVNTTQNGLQFTLIDGEDSSYFSVGERNGSVYLIISPDREKQSLLRTKIKVDAIKKGRKLVYPVYPSDLDPNEIRIVVRIKDVNDNAPRFIPSGRPFVAAIPSSATYGYPIIRLHAEDIDEGLNGEVHYEIMGREDSDRFMIDPISGHVRALSSFAKEKGRVFGFDVKATDRRGAHDGKVAITNVFVYVLDDDRKLAMVMGARPNEIEVNIRNITRALSNVTGLDVRVRKLEPHFNKEATDMYLYAVDPLMNVIIDSETLKHVLRARGGEVRRAVEPYRLLGLAEGGEVSGPAKSRLNLSALELATIVLGCIVFLGAITSALCVVCLHKRKRKVDTFKMGVAPFSADLMFHTKEMKARNNFGPGAFTEGSTDSYISGNRSECGYKRERRERRSMMQPRAQPGLKASLASVHSSGRDSGIVEAPHCCPCSHSPSHSSANSSHGSYEDSLKSLQRRQSDNRRKSTRSTSLHPYPPPLPPPALSRHPSGHHFQS